MGNLFVVATPIGNLEDITIRAVRILNEVDIIICEDTRVTSKLLQRFDIKKKMISYHQHSRIQKLDEINGLLRDGRNLALVTDAGTPGISDPGNKLISQLLDRNEDLKISPIPGPSALTCAASVSGLPTDRFIFFGFLPHKKGRQTIMKKIADSKETVLYYESPHRILKSLAQLKEVLSENRKVIVFRELTKKFEQRIGVNAKECYEYFENNPNKINGEFVVVVAGK